MESIENVEAKWYVLHTYPGYENIVKDNLEKLVDKHSLQERILEITIPMEDTIEEKNGKRKVVQRRMFPCYVMLKMRYTPDMWYLITGTRGVTGFVGPQGRPMPLTEEEIRKMRLENFIVEVDFQAGDKVKVINGPLEGFIGDVEEVDAHNQKCRVCVSMFGRQTPVELDLFQIEKI